MRPHKTYIPHIPAFIYLVCFSAGVYCSRGIFMAFFLSSSLFCTILFSVYTKLNLNRMFSSTFIIFLLTLNKKILQSDIFTAIFQHLLIFEEMEPMFVIHNISIATDDDIIQFGDDVNIYPVFLSRAMII